MAAFYESHLKLVAINQFTFSELQKSWEGNLLESALITCMQLRISTHHAAYVFWSKVWIKLHFEMSEYLSPIIMQYASTIREPLTYENIGLAYFLWFFE